jgi:hypothetical protein
MLHIMHLLLLDAIAGNTEDKPYQRVHCVIVFFHPEAE